MYQKIETSANFTKIKKAILHKTGMVLDVYDSGTHYV